MLKIMFYYEKEFNFLVRNGNEKIISMKFFEFHKTFNRLRNGTKIFWIRMNLFERKEASKIRYICLLDMYHKIQEK